MDTLKDIGWDDDDEEVAPPSAPSANRRASDSEIDSLDPSQLLLLDVEREAQQQQRQRQRPSAQPARAGDTSWDSFDRGRRQEFSFAQYDDDDDDDYVSGDEDDARGRPGDRRVDFAPRGPVDAAVLAWWGRYGPRGVNLQPHGRKADGAYLFGARVMKCRVVEDGDVECRVGAAWISVEEYVSRFAEVERKRERAFRAAIPALGMLLSGGGIKPGNTVVV
eukprot:m51a1_g10930 hypothetical protein (221) ;mRNA; f:137206-137937